MVPHCRLMQTSLSLHRGVLMIHIGSLFQRLLQLFYVACDVCVSAGRKGRDKVASIWVRMKLGLRKG